MTSSGRPAFLSGDVNDLDIGDDDFAAPKLPTQAKRPLAPPTSPTVVVVSSPSAAVAQPQPQPQVISTQSQFQSDRIKAAVTLLRNKPHQQSPSAAALDPQKTAAATAATNSHEEPSPPQKRRKSHDADSTVGFPDKNEGGGEGEKSEEERSGDGDEDEEGRMADGSLPIEAEQRSIPGPAGSLPKRDSSVPPSQLTRASVRRAGGAVPSDGVIIQSRLSLSHRRAQTTSQSSLALSAVTAASPVTSSPTDMMDGGAAQQDDVFLGGAWLEALKSLRLGPFGGETLASNIKYIVSEGFRTKVPRLLALVCAMHPVDNNVKLTLRDPTGTMNGMAQRRALEQRPELKVGSVVCLKKTSVFSSSPTTHSLNVVLENIEHVFNAGPADSSESIADADRLASFDQRSSLYTIAPIGQHQLRQPQQQPQPKPQSPVKSPKKPQANSPAKSPVHKSPIVVRPPPPQMPSSPLKASVDTVTQNQSLSTQSPSQLRSKPQPQPQPQPQSPVSARQQTQQQPQSPVVVRQQLPPRAVVVVPGTTAVPAVIPVSPSMQKPPAVIVAQPPKPQPRQPAAIVVAPPQSPQPRQPAASMQPPPQPQARVVAMPAAFNARQPRLGSQPMGTQSSVGEATLARLDEFLNQ